jgi:hypothetical protein
MAAYSIIFNGYAANRSVYRRQEIRIDTPYNWSRNKIEAENVMFLVHKKLHEHFGRYEILLIEKIN